MSNVIDLTGQVFGRLTVLKREGSDKHGKAMWLCQCSCGNQKVINGASLRRGLTVSCGCKKAEEMQKYNEAQTINEIGNRYGKLTVISKNTEQKDHDGRALWNCQCDCGNVCIVAGKLLRNGHVGSCGCGIKSIGEKTIETLLKQANINFSFQYSIKINQNLYDIQQVHPYYFDFAIFQNNALSYFIEYDGEQHFEYKNSNSFWLNEDNYKKTIIRDNLKNQWCKDNNIPLIRIPYTHLKDLCLDDLKLETSSFIVS